MIAKDFDELLNCGNFAIVDAAMKCEQVFTKHERARVSISGGADSDVMLDLCERVHRVAPDIQLVYTWYDTGMEYAATKRHLLYLEEKYGISIERIRAVKTIPVCQRDYGQPFASKLISEYIERLQRHGFHWEDDPLDVLLKRYPKCRSSLRWWKNDFTSNPDVPTRFDISRRRYLKEFLMEHPPTFPISPKCCTYAKKNTAKKSLKGFDLNVIGVRRAEGGVRSLGQQCYVSASKKLLTATYRPLFWFASSDRKFYEEAFGIRHSECYEVWGFKRTGCVGCPFNMKLERESWKSSASTSRTCTRPLARCSRTPMPTRARSSSSNASTRRWSSEWRT